MKLFFTLWILGSFALDVVLAARARARLMRQFRRSSTDFRTHPELEPIRPASTKLSLGKA